MAMRIWISAVWRSGSRDMILSPKSFRQARSGRKPVSRGMSQPGRPSREIPRSPASSETTSQPGLTSGA